MIRLNIHLVSTDESQKELCFLLTTNKTFSVSELSSLVIKKAHQLFKKQLEVVKCYDNDNDSFEGENLLENIFFNNSHVYFLTQNKQEKKQTPQNEQIEKNQTPDM